MAKPRDHMSTLKVAAGAVTYTPLGTLPLVYIEVNSIQLWPKWPLSPKVRINEYRYG